MGLYSESVESLEGGEGADQLAQGASVAISNDPVNGARGIDLLVQQGLLTLSPDAPDETLS